MCPVQWRKPVPADCGTPFLIVPPKRLVVFLTRPDEHTCIALHWKQDGGGSYPCLGDECFFCPEPSFVHCYAGVLAWDGALRSWHRRIVDLGTPGSELAQTDLRGSPVVVQRKKLHEKRSPLEALDGSDVSDVTLPVESEPFDVRIPLMRRWHLFDEADRLVCEAYYEQARLQFPTRGAS